MSLITIEVDPEVMIGLIETVCSSLDVIDNVALGNDTDTLCTALRTAQIAASTLSVLSDGWFSDVLEEGDEGTVQRPATDDPATCGHPIPFPAFPDGSVMCSTCGDIKNRGGQWGE
jgi:hypothetical protein